MKYLKNILAVFIISLAWNISAQIEEGFISYKVEIIDETSGFPLDQLFAKAKFDVQFNVKFSKRKTRVYQQETHENRTTYIHDKQSGTVLSLTESSSGKYFFYSNAVGPQIKSLGHNYGDTSIIWTDETKEILGHSCRKVELNLGGQGIATFWVAEEVSVGAVVPESPLALDHPALEYTLVVGGTKTHYIATSFETKIDDAKGFEETIPEGFKLIVPIDEYDQGGIFSAPEFAENGKFSFVNYPEYPTGKESLYKLFNDIPAYQATEEDFIFDDDNEPFYLGPSTVSIECTVNKDGTLSNMRVQLSPNAEIKNAVLERIKEMTAWTPARIRGVAVDSEISIIINIPVNTTME